LNPYQPIKDFEAALRGYCGAPYAVAVNSGTAALLLSILWANRQKRYVGGKYITEIEIPRHTYVSVACAITNAGLKPVWRDEAWQGVYQLRPYPVWDCARRFTSGMYVAGQYQCVSFATAKILGAEQGGAILHDDRDADSWFRKMRFDGRTEGVDPLEDTFDLVGHHCIMLPSVAAELNLKLYHLPKQNPDLPYYKYPDLSLHEAFK
jgi:dTDP-4-amino-4,6-dideoxygalactose transaminase